MKRDMDLIRALLIGAEASEGDFDCFSLVGNSYDRETIAYNVELLQGAGFVNANCQYASGRVSVMAIIESITWSGHDFLDAVKSDKVWHKAKAVIKKAVGETSFTVVKETCLAIAKSFIDANL